MWEVTVTGGMKGEEERKRGGVRLEQGRIRTRGSMRGIRRLLAAVQLTTRGCRQGKNNINRERRRERSEERWGGQEVGVREESYGEARK